MPIESLSQLVSVRNDGEGGVTIANERKRIAISTNKRTGILTSDQSETKDDYVPGVWMGPTRVSLIATTQCTYLSENCEIIVKTLNFRDSRK